MAFAFAVGHGFESTIVSFSVAHQIGAAAWRVALVLMALLERYQLPCAPVCG